MVLLPCWIGAGWTDHLNFRGRQRHKVGAVNLWTTARHLPRCVFGGVARKLNFWREQFRFAQLGMRIFMTRANWVLAWIEPWFITLRPVALDGKTGLEKLRKCALCTFALRSGQRLVRIPTSPGTRFRNSPGTLEPSYIETLHRYWGQVRSLDHKQDSELLHVFCHMDKNDNSAISEV